MSTRALVASASTPRSPSLEVLCAIPALCGAFSRYRAWRPAAHGPHCLPRPPPLSRASPPRASCPWGAARLFQLQSSNARKLRGLHTRVMLGGMRTLVVGAALLAGADAFCAVSVNCAPRAGAMTTCAATLAQTSSPLSRRKAVVAAGLGLGLAPARAGVRGSVPGADQRARAAQARKAVLLRAATRTA